MLNLKGKKSKTAQYAIGGVVGFVILILWFSVPLMDKSAWNTAVPEGNPFSSKSVDLRGLSDGMSYESGAPGSPLSGAMIDNPATSGQDINSSLYSSGFDEISDGEGADGAASSGVVAKSDGSSSKHSGFSNAPQMVGSKGTLSRVASIGGSGGGSGTSGKKHGKFFGGGNDKAKFSTNYNAPIGKAKKAGKLLASANNAQNQGKKAEDINLKGKEEAGRSGIAAAFNNLAESADSQLTSGLEQAAADSGIAEGEIGGDLKKSDPGLNKNDSTPPAPGEPEESIDQDEQFKQMIMKMAIQMVLGSVFGSMGSMMSAAMTIPQGAETDAIGQNTDISKPPVN